MKHIAFIVGSGDISGGTNIIFNHAMNLVANHGLSVSIITKKKLTAKQVSWHAISLLVDNGSLQWLDYDQASIGSFDLVIATYWLTVFDLARFKAKQYAYLIQSIESRFTDMSNLPERIYIEKTYELPVHKITIANWLTTYLKQVHGQASSVVLNGVDKNRFNTEGPAISPRKKGHLRVLVEGQLDSPMKNMKHTIEICRQSKADEIWLLTNTPCKKYRGIDRVFSGIPHHKTAEVYRSCDVLVKLSLVEGMFGPPLEMFHCGGAAVVYSVTGYDEYIKHRHNALVADMHDEGKVLEYINDLKQCPELLDQLKRNAIDTANEWLTVDESSEQFFKVIQNLVPGLSTQQVLSWEALCLEEKHKRLLTGIGGSTYYMASVRESNGLAMQLLKKIYHLKWVNRIMRRPAINKMAWKVLLSLQARRKCDQCAGKNKILKV